MEGHKIINLLQNTKASSIGSSQVLTCKSDMKIPSIYKMIYEHKIHALPVQDSQSNEFKAFIDLQDIVAALFGTFTDEELEHVNIPQLTEWKGELIRVIGEKESYALTPEVPDPAKINTFASKTVGEVGKSPLYSLTEDQSIYNVIETIINKSLPDRHVHRVALQSAPHMISKLVTQSDLIRFLNSNISKFGDAANLTVAQLKLDQAHHEIFKVKGDAITLEAFKLMNSKHIYGIAVVDKDDRVVGSLSMADLRLILFNASEIVYLYLGISEYIQKVHKKASDLPDKDISVTSDSKLSDVLHSFVNNHVHRVFIVDKDHKLTGIITMGDILRAIVNSKL